MTHLFIFEVHMKFYTIIGFALAQGGKEMATKLKRQENKIIFPTLRDYKSQANFCCCYCSLV